MPRLLLLLLLLLLLPPPLMLAVASVPRLVNRMRLRSKTRPERAHVQVLQQEAMQEVWELEQEQDLADRAQAQAQVQVQEEVPEAVLMVVVVEARVGTQMLIGTCLVNR